MTEQHEAARINARLQRNSGRGRLQKGDARWHNFLVDIKEYAAGFRVSTKNWAKLCTDAARHNADPMFLLALTDGGRTIRLAVIELSMLERLLDNES